MQIQLIDVYQINGQTEIFKSEDRQDHGLQNETKDKHVAHNITLRTKAEVTQTLQKPEKPENQGEFRVRNGKKLMIN